jgi:hypothetical protein
VIYRSVGIDLSARLRQMSLESSIAFKPRVCRSFEAQMECFGLEAIPVPCVQQPTTWKGRLLDTYGTVPALYVSNPQLNRDGQFCSRIGR